jgi:Domain of unknown function (DUF222)
LSEAGGSVVFEQTFERLPVGVSSVAVDWGADPSVAGAAGSPGARPELDALEAAATTLVAGDPAALDGESLAAEVARLEMVTARLASREAACVAVLDARGDVQRWGFRSTQAWLRAAVRLAPGAAKGLVALARRLYGKEATSGRGATVSAFAAGRIGLAHAQIVTRTMTEIGSVFPDPAEAATMEKELVAVAERTDPLRLAGACRRLLIAAAPEQAVAADWDAFQRRELSVAKTFGGMVAINGVLDPLSGETVAAAIHSLSGPTEQDERTPGQRRADALAEVCRRILGFTDLPTNGGERPQVNLTMPFSVLTELPGGAFAEEADLALSGPDAAELAWAGPVSAELARRILCDATVTRIVLDPASQPLDVGRATRVVPAGMRRAVAVRDRHCQWPGCDVPAVWCDVHHLRHWSRGGVTALRNLVMLCGWHHTQLHLTRQTLIRHCDGRVELAPDLDHNADNTDRGP